MTPYPTFPGSSDLGVQVRDLGVTLGRARIFGVQVSVRLLLYWKATTLVF